MVRSIPFSAALALPLALAGAVMVIVMLVSACAFVAFAAETTPAPVAPTTSETEAARWGYVGLPNPPDWMSPKVAIDATFDIGKLPYWQIYATSRSRAGARTFLRADSLLFFFGRL